jgi:hypothetical protein
MASLDVETDRCDGGMTPKPSPEGLRAFTKAHRVNAEVFPHYEIHDHHPIQTGFALTLLGLPSPRCAGDPGCQECERVHAVLRDMAVSVVPETWRHLHAPFEAAFHYRADTQWQPEIEAVVQMFPYDQTWETVDAAALREIPGMRKRLHEMGVRESTQAAL